MLRVHPQTYNQTWMLVASALPIIGDAVSHIALTKINETMRVQGHPDHLTRAYNHIVANYETAAAIRNALFATIFVALVVLGIASGVFTGISLSLIILIALILFSVNATVEHVFSAIEHSARANLQPQ